jgi:hypothetical protein
MTVPVNFDRGAARSGIRQIGNVIIFHLRSSFMESHSWLKVHDQTAFCWVLLELYGGGFGIIRGAFAIIRGGSSIYIRGDFTIIPGAFTIIRGAFTIHIRGIRSGSSIKHGAFNIIRNAFIQHYFHILSMYMLTFGSTFGMWLTMLFASGLQ